MKIIKHYSVWLQLFVLIACTTLPFKVSADDGVIFSVQLDEGVKMNFRVISEAEKTCQVGSGKSEDGYQAIPSNKISTLSIPSQANGYSVIKIANHAFASINGLQSVTIPNSVISIDESAFHDCSTFTLTTVNISANLRVIGRNAFRNCAVLTSIILPSSLTEIGQEAFYNCSSITSLSIPNSVTAIGKEAFYGCTSLSSLSLSNSLSSIDDGVFGCCSSITSITIPSSVNSIGKTSFGGCESLKSIVLPQTITSIGRNAFDNCTKLDLVVSKIDNPFPVDNTTFMLQPGMGLHSTLQVPHGTKDKYLQYSGWINYFSTIVEEKAYYTLSIKALGNGSVTYNNEVIRGTTNSYSLEEGLSASISISPDEGYKIKSVKVNDNDVTSSISSNTYTISSISSNTTIEVEFEAIPPTTYTLTIKATGNGSASYDGTTIKGKTSTFTVNEGTSATISFTPDNGYQIKSLKVNNAAVTASTSYTLTVNANTTVEVEFEAIPPTTYSLTISASGNGSASYGGETIKGTSKSFTVNEGTSATITFTPDNGYQIKSLKVNNAAVTASTSYTLTVNANTTVEVEFEAIPPTTYSLTISASGNGSASYGGETIKGTSKSFTVNEGTSATITFTPDNGYQIKSLKVNNAAVTASTSYTLTVNANTTVEVEFEAIPVTTYTLSIKATGNGSASYGNEIIKNATKTYTVNEGTSATINFTPDNGYRIKSLVVNNKAVTASTSYTVTVNANTSVEVEFEAIPVTTYTLSIKATGNGSASYGSETIKNKTKIYTVNEGTSATITFTPDNGYRIKSLLVNNKAVTASTSYTVTVNANTSVEVEFEAIPVTTYTLSIKATGNGSASYGNETIKNATKTYTVNEGTSATITFTPDNGYRIKSLVVNSKAVTASTSYTVTVNANTSVEVEFEAIPVTTYTLSIKATGNGSASYGNETIKNTTKTYTVNEGTSATITFTPDNGYRIKSLVVNNKAVTASTSYTVTVNSNTSVEVVFEAIPATTYTLSIKATGNGSASYSGTTITGTTKSFTVNEGTSATITFTPDNGYRIKSLLVNNKSVTASTSYTVVVNANTSIEVDFEAIPTYTLSIKATGNGSVSYSGSTIRGTSKSFTVYEGTSAEISFAPDDGYRIKSLKVNNTAVSASSSYTVTINGDTSVEVEFEAIPPTTYTLSVKATGNGYAAYNGKTIRGKTSTFTVNEGTSATITFSPDDGYQIKSLKVNNSAVTKTTSYKVTINSDTSVEVEFEAIPDNPDTPDTPKTYTLSIRAKGNGAASYEGEEIREKTSEYTLEEGTKAVITFTPDEGYQISSLKVNGSSVTATDTYEVTVNMDTSVKVEFEKIPDNPEGPITYSLSIKASGNGIASYEGEIIRDNTSTFTVNEGASATISFTPDNGYEINSVIVNGSDVTSEASRHQYTLTMNADTSLEVDFKESERQNSITVDGNTYQIVSDEEQTLMLGSCSPGLVLVVPEKVDFLDMEWTVVGIAYNALENNEELAAIIWNPETPFNAKVTNPNLLLYVKDESYGPADIENVVVNGYAKSIILIDAQSGNNFYCPVSFTAETIEYNHSYYMKTGLYESRGWETISLPFEVQHFSHGSKGEIVPFANWISGSEAKPFWLYELSGSGFVEAETIKANTPYIISMPNHDAYPNEYHLTGRISFSSENVMVENSDNLQTATYSSNTFVPNFTCSDANAGYYVLNVSNDFEYYRGSENEGSKFILNLRKIHPFEAFMTSTSGTRSIDISEGMTTGIRGIEEIVSSPEVIKVYDLSGRLIKSGRTMDAIKQELPTGVYIVNNKKMIIK